MKIPFLTAFREKRNLQRFDEYLEYLMAGGGTGSAGVPVTTLSVLSSSAVYAAVSLLATSVAALPLNVIEQQDKIRQSAVNYGLYRVLHTKANPEQTSYIYREQVMWHLLLQDRHFSEIEYGNNGRVVALWPLQPNQMRVERDPATKQILYKYTLPGGQGVILPANRVLHIQGKGSGKRLIDIGQDSFGLTLAIQKYLAMFFGNGARMGGILEHPGKMTQPAKESLAKHWKEAYGGMSNAHRTAILEEGMKYTPIGVDPETAQALESRKFQVSEVARWFNVPPHMIQDLERSTFCLPADVEVMTEHGPKSIATINKGDKVWSLDEDKFILAEVERSECTGNDEILEIRTSNRVIRANAKHPILIRRKTPDPKQGVGGYQSVKWENKFVTAGELIVGDTLITLSQLPEGCVEKIGDRKLSIGFMEVCGLILGDGNVFDGSVCIARSEKALYMDHYREAIKQEFVSYGKRGNGRGEPPATTVVSLGEYERQTKFSSVLAGKELKELGLSGDARSKRVPDWVFTVTDSLKLAFIRGYLDSDGTVDKKGRVSFASVSLEMLSQIRTLCMSLGIPVTNMRTQKAVATLPSGKKFDSIYHTFTCSDPGQNKKIWSHDSRYQERLLNAKPFNKKDRNYPRFGGRGFDFKWCSLSRITSIEKQKTEPVYDLCVSGTHSFIANGVVVHNSNIEHQAIQYVVYSLLNPWLIRIEQQLNVSLIPDSEQGRYYTKFNVAGLLRGDFQSRQEGYKTGVQNGWYSINDVRDYEDLNPCEGGDTRFVPMNMMPLDQVEAITKARLVPKPAPTAPAQPQQNSRAEKRAQLEPKSPDKRLNTTKLFKPLFEEAATRVMKREKADVMKQITKMSGNRDARALDPKKFEDWLDKYFDDQKDFVRNTFDSTFTAFFAAIQADAIAEADTEVDLSGMQEYQDQYMDKFTERTIGESKSDIKTAIAKAEEGNKDPVEELQTKYNEWETKKPADTAQEETIRASEAIAKMVFFVAGFTGMRWHARGQSCPYCKHLDGKVVGIKKRFVDKDGSIAVPGLDAFTSSRNVGHAPLHRGCDCYTTPTIL